MGYADVDRMLAGMSSLALSEWMAYEQVEGPLGGVRSDSHAALVAATVANAFRGKKSRPVRFQDFLLRWDQHREPVAAADLLNRIKGINRRLRGREGVNDGDSR